MQNDVTEGQTVRTDRSCGECTACCEGWLSAQELDMYAGSPCKHRTSEGCAIYHERPTNPCKTFQCGWLSGALPEDVRYRPDQCGAILLTDRQQAGWSVWRAVPAGRSVPEKTLDELKLLAEADEKPFVWVERVEDFVAEPRKTSKYAIGPEAFLTALKWDFQQDDIWDLS